MAEWVTPTYAATNFTGNNINWIVAAADIAAYDYQIVGRTMTLSLSINSSSTIVAGGGDEFRVQIPASRTANKYATVPAMVIDNGSTVPSYAQTAPGLTYVAIKQHSGFTFATSTDNTGVHFQIIFEVE